MKYLISIVTDMTRAEDTLNYSASLGKDLGYGILFLRAIRPEVYDVGTHDTMATTVGYAHEQIKADMDTTRENFEKIIEDLKKSMENAPSMDFTVEVGQSLDIIRDMSLENDVGMLLIDRDSTGYGLLLPETSMEIIRNFEKPVFVKPSDSVYRPFRHIVYGTDYHEEDIKTLNKLVDIAGIFNAKITAVHVSSDTGFQEKLDSEGFKSIVREKAEYSNLDILAIQEEEGKDKQETLNDFAAKAGADLIVLLKENRNFFERIFKQSSTRKLMQLTDKALLVFHE